MNASPSFAEELLLSRNFPQIDEFLFRGRITAYMEISAEETAHTCCEHMEHKISTKNADQSFCP
jgi:hypothetical protein